MIGFVSKIGKPLYNKIRKILSQFKTSDLENVVTSDGNNFKVQP